MSLTITRLLYILIWRRRFDFTMARWLYMASTSTMSLYETVLEIHNL